MATVISFPQSKSTGDFLSNYTISNRDTLKNHKNRIIIQRITNKDINVNGMQLKKIRIPLK